MNCETVTADLVSLLYDELEYPRKQIVLRHLETCTHCQREWEELLAGRDLLNRLDSVGECQVDVEQLYVTSARQSTRRNRWWKRAATVAIAASILLLFVAAVKIRVTFEQNRLTICWGEPDLDRAGQGEAAEQILQYLDHMQQLESRLNSSVTQVERNQLRQGTVLASLESELHHVRQRSDVRWRTTDLARRENSQQLAAVRLAVDDMLRQARTKNRSIPRSMLRPPRGG